MASDEPIRWTVVLHVPALVKPGTVVAVKGSRNAEAAAACAIRSIASHHGLDAETITADAVFRGAGYFADELRGFAPVGEVKGA